MVASFDGPVLEESLYVAMGISSATRTATGNRETNALPFCACKSNGACVRRIKTPVASIAWYVCTDVFNRVHAMVRMGIRCI